MRKFESQDLQYEYENDASFKKKVDRGEQEYLELYLKARQLYRDGSIDESYFERFIRKGKVRSTFVYFIYGFLMPQPGTATTALTLHFIKRFMPDPNEEFLFVFFNNKTHSSDYYKEFRNVFLLLPMTMLERMQAFILVKPNFYLKAVNFLFGSANKLFNQRYQEVPNCQALCDTLSIPIHEFVSFVPEELAENFPEKYKRRQSICRYRMNVFGQNLSESQATEKKQYDQEINALVHEEVYTLENYELGELGIPVILQLLVGYFATKPDELKSEGIFRKSVSVDEQEETLRELSNRNYEYLDEITNPHLVASLIKKFFYNLKEPVIPFASFHELMKGSGNQLQPLKQVLLTIPRLNFITLMYLLDFLKRDVVSKSEHNKMDLKNVAICFSPTLMKAEIPSEADIVYAAKGVSLTNLMLTHLDDIFGDEEARRKVFKENMTERSNLFQKTIMEQLQFPDEEEKQEAAQSVGELSSSSSAQKSGQIRGSFLKKNMSAFERSGGSVRLSQRDALSLTVIQSSQISLNEKLKRVSNVLKDAQERYTLWKGKRQKQEEAEKGQVGNEEEKPQIGSEVDETVKVQINVNNVNRASIEGGPQQEEEGVQYEYYYQQSDDYDYNQINIPSPGGSPRNSVQQHKIRPRQPSNNLKVSNTSQPRIRRRAKKLILKQADLKDSTIRQ